MGNNILTFEQAVQAALDGKELQFKMHNGWCDSVQNGNTKKLIEQLVNMWALKWRKKPDAFDEAWAEHYKAHDLGRYSDNRKESIRLDFKAGWDARGEHKGDE